MVESPPAVWETQVQSLGQEEPLEEEMATPSSILAWRAPRTEEPGGPQPMGSQSIGHERLTPLLRPPFQGPSSLEAPGRMECGRKNGQRSSRQVSPGRPACTIALGFWSS